ncbi:MAG: hypothetical protein ACYC6A_14970 [Armatimonadota bacterium]
MNTTIKVIVGILILLVLFYIGGIVLNLLGEVILFALRIVIGALVVLAVIWLIGWLARGKRT